MSAAEKATSFPRNKKASAPRSGKAPASRSKSVDDSYREYREWIKSVAASAGLDEDEFLHRSAVSQARDIEEGKASVSTLSSEAFEKLLADLERPGKFIPGLARAIKESKGVLRDPDLDD